MCLTCLGVAWSSLVTYKHVIRDTLIEGISTVNSDYISQCSHWEVFFKDFNLQESQYLSTFYFKMTLLKTPYLVSLYKDAHTYSDRENPSIEFWVVVLYYFLPAPVWNHAREFPPGLNDPIDLRKMDIVSRKYATKKCAYFYSGNLEGKRPNYD